MLYARSAVGPAQLAICNWPAVELEANCDELSTYSAVIVCMPELSEDTVRLARPLESTETGPPRLWAPSRKVTTPAFTGTVLETAAVSTACAPHATGLA